MLRSFTIRSAVCVGLAIAAAPAALAQYSTGFEAPVYSGDADGEALTNGFGGPPGVDNWYNPVTGTTDFRMYTYLGNTLNIPPNPRGCNQFVAGRREDVTTFCARAQRNVDFSSAGVWEAEYDVCALFTGTLPTAQNIGSWSMQDSLTSRFFQSIWVWTDIATGTNWNGQYNAYNSTGAATNFLSPGPEWNNLNVNQWYRMRQRWNFTTNQILEVSITDLDTGITTTVNPTDWWLTGGSTPTLPLPTGTRLFVGGGTCAAGTGGAGNVMAFDNFRIAPVGAAPCPGDINGDLTVDITDLAILLSAYGSTACESGYNAAADSDGDGDVDLADLASLLSLFGTTC
ncbi:MAG: hypothetical protein AMXMBFR47_04020 [Planctomycetota bacterium]